MNDPDDTIQALTESIAAQQALIEKADKLIEHANRPTPTFKSEPVIEPKSAAEQLAAREAEFQRLVADPESDMAVVKRARVKLDRAKLAAEAEEKQHQHFASMARSIELQHAESAEREAAERKAAKERKAIEDREMELKWGHAKRQQFIRTGGRG
jgi:hypothetical protein